MPPVTPRRKMRVHSSGRCGQDFVTRPTAEQCGALKELRPKRRCCRSHPGAGATSTPSAASESAVTNGPKDLTNRLTNEATSDSAPADPTPATPDDAA